TVKPWGLGFAVEDGCLTEGQSISLIWEPFSWTPLSGLREFKVTFDSPGGGPEVRLPEPLVVTILPLEAEKLEITLPCTHKPGQSLTGRITVRDRFDNRVPIDAEIALSDAGQNKNLTLVSGLGDCVLDDRSGEAIRITGKSASFSAEGVSNPSVSSKDYQLYIGDFHTHDFLSESMGYPDEVYRWAIEDRKLDFLSVVPQSHGWHDNETWTVTKYMNERFLHEGKFVTFLGFEWQHTGYGDKIVHYLGGDQPYLPVDDSRYTSPAKLYDALSGSDAFVISHHTAYPPGGWCPATDFDAVDNDIERVVEIWSMHGSSEGYDPDDRPLRGHDSNHTAMAALRKGLKLGFVAGSDTHCARPGGSAHEPLGQWGGLAAIWAKDLTRRSLFEAVRARRTYALTRARIVLNMTVNGAWMGSELPASETAQIRIEAWGEAPIAKVEVIKNTKFLRSFGPYDETCNIELEDITDGPAFYHCRITQSDGELAVCSPVWIG
ncbi:MAG: CehA/McbA family metallohydrolase, partial [Armatimonadota bacterium]